MIVIHLFTELLSNRKSLFSAVVMYISDLNRSSPPAMFLEEGVQKICSKFTGEHPCQRVILIKLLWFSVDFRKLIFTTPFPKNVSGGLLLFKTTYKSQKSTGVLKKNHSKKFQSLQEKINLVMKHINLLNPGFY